MANWVCIRDCIDPAGKRWRAGTFFTGKEPPTPHFESLDQPPSSTKDPVDILREKIEELTGKPADKRWSLKRLQDLYQIEKEKVEKAEKKAKVIEDGVHDGTGDS